LRSLQAMKRILVVVILVVTLLLALGGGGVLYARHILYTPLSRDTGEQDYLFDINRGQGLRTVAQRMEAAGLIRNARLLELYGRFQGLQGQLQAGRYILSRAQAPVEMLQRIVSGEAEFDELTITIPEGFSAEDIALRLGELQLFDAARFRDAVVMQDAYRDFSFLEYLADGMILEGYLFPDTYRVFPDSTPEAIIRRMLENFSRRVYQPFREEITGTGKSLHEILTLASIVQKEAADTPEMPDVAGVFTNRLRIGMRLESDATVNYVLGTNRRQPLFRDVAVEHPYNTYRNAGLPPGPIGNPGVAAILASIHPAEHDFLFFLHKHSYEIVLTHTFREHLAAKARYLD